MFFSTQPSKNTTQQGDCGKNQYIVYLKIPRGEDLKCFQHREMITACSDGTPKNPDFIITYSMHVSQYHM